MNDDRDQDDSISDIWLKNWEQQCIDHLESEPDYEGQLNSDRDLATQKAWCNFQNAATSVAHLYKDRVHDVGSLWLPFQTAAGTVTTLYKESSESLRRSSEVGVQCGYQRRNKEILSWARKKRRNIRREDLISYLAGKTLPPRPATVHRSATARPMLLVSERHHHQSASERHHLNFNLNHLHHHLHHHVAATNVTEDNLHMFKEALTLAGAGSRRQRAAAADLNAFMAGEYTRHSATVKRQASPQHSHDVNMDSPTHPKRPRFL